MNNRKIPEISLFKDKKIENDADSLIDLIANAQDENGYLNTYFTIKDREKRWENLLGGTVKLRAAANRISQTDSL